MTKKKWIVVLITVVLAGLLCGVFLIRKNERYGRELYNAANSMSVQSALLTDSMDFLEEKIAQGEQVGKNRFSFDQAMAMIWSGFGSEDMPLLQDVWHEYLDRFEALRETSRTDEGLEQLFTDPEESDQTAQLKSKLETMTKAFIEFHDRYNDMTTWERRFAPWKKEQQRLNELVKLS